MRNFKWIGFLGAAVLGLTSCTKETVIEKQAPPSDVRASFTSTDSDLCKNKNCVKLQKSSLDKTFLLVISGKTSGQTPQWYDLKPQVVTFSKMGGEVAILAENYNTIYNEIKSQHLVQSFAVVSEDETSITFDWGRGFKSFAVEQPYDIERPEMPWTPDGSFQSLPVTDSFIQSMNTENAEYFEFNQIAKILTPQITPNPKGPSSTDFKEESLGMNIQLRPYIKSAHFLVKEADASKRVGFFVTKISVQAQSKIYKNLIAKWDISDEKGPIKVRITSSVPAEYLEAVKEGALYWNKVFKKDIITVETGVDPNTGPVHRAITIRWVPWLDAGAAYAINQSDPLTGEILRSQVFMPSAFTRIGSGDQVLLNGNVPVASGAIKCDFRNAHPASLNAEILALPVSKRTVLAQDAVRTTVSHEMGHALGLRHNFAGSFSSKVTGAEAIKAAKTFLSTPESPGLPMATTVMDYIGGIDQYLTSRYSNKHALDYDVMAMAWAYASDDQALDESVSLYCSDEHIDIAGKQGFDIYGCERFDAGSNPIERNFLGAFVEKNNYVATLFASILGRLYPADQPGVRASLGEVIAQTYQWVDYAPASLAPLGAMIRKVKDSSGRSVPGFASIDLVKSGQFFLAGQDRDKIFIDKLLKDVAITGGYGNILAGLAIEDEKFDPKWIETQLNELMKKDYFKKGVTLGGRAYELSDSDQEQIQNFFISASERNRQGVFLKALTSLLPFLNSSGQNNSKPEGAWLREGVVKPEESVLIAGTFKKLLEGEQFELNYGPVPRKSIIVAQSAIRVGDIFLWKNLLSTDLMQVPMASALGEVVDFQIQKINTALALINPGYSLGDPAGWGSWPQKLQDEGLVDANGVKYFASEIEILKKLANSSSLSDLK